MVVRTTIDIPDPLFRRTKALAAVRGTSLKALVIKAVEREVNQRQPEGATERRRIPPVIHLRHRDKLDLTGFDFDDLLA